MKVRPISILAPQIHLISAGLLTRLFRPGGGHLDALRPGDLLWVREHFHLDRRFDNVSPLQAAGRGATPVFCGGQIGDTSLSIGRRRFARELPRIWHRQHLAITGCSHRSLGTITDAEIAAQGFALRSSFAEAWDLNLSLAKSGRDSAHLWRRNPTVLVLDFERVAMPADRVLGAAA